MDLVFDFKSNIFKKTFSRAGFITYAPRVYIAKSNKEPIKY